MPAGVHGMSRGTVEHFDDHAGIGHVRTEQGHRLRFHCVSLADGSRAVPVGAPVRFRVVAGHRGEWEASDVEVIGPSSVADTDGGFACPVCGLRLEGEAGTYEICSRCGWEDDPAQRDDTSYAGGANHESLDAARARWEAGPSDQR